MSEGDIEVQWYKQGATYMLRMSIDADNYIDLTLEEARYLVGDFMERFTEIHDHME